MRERKDTKEKEVPLSRYPFIAIVGPVGIGKTTFMDLFAKDIGIKEFQEPYRENPYLNSFYTKDPSDFSFDTQMFFLATKGVQMGKVKEEVLLGPVVQDPGTDVDYMIATAQMKMGWMSLSEYDAYKRSFDNVFSDTLKPDMYIALTASKETVMKRIKQRGRPMEMEMLKKYPDYFQTLVEEFDNWLAEQKNLRIKKIAVIDTDVFDYMKGEDKKDDIILEAKNWAHYYLSHPHQRNSVGSDGANIQIPRSFGYTPYHLEEVVPGKIKNH